MDSNVVNNFVKVSQTHTHVVIKSAGGLRGVEGPAGAGLEISGSVDTYADLPWQLTTYDAGKAYFVQSNGLLYVWSGTRWPAEEDGSSFQGPRGIQGPQGDPGKDSFVPDEATFKAQVLDIVYPIGSIYMSVNSASPQTFLGGTWERIQDKFILSAGSSYQAGSSGGSASIDLSHSHTVNAHNHSLPANTGSHTLTVDEIPSHQHWVYNYNANGADTDYYPVNFNATKKGYSGNVLTNSVGGGAGHTHTIGGNTGDKSPNTDSKLSSTQSILPPYLAVYVWKRTA
jgi:hypothetical protein